jgi:hypothetical protein
MNLEEFLDKLNVKHVTVADHGALVDAEYSSYTLKRWDDANERTRYCELDLPANVDANPVVDGVACVWEEAFLYVRSALRG